VAELTLVPAAQDNGAALRARHKVAGCGAWHGALTMRAARSTLRLSTRCTWLVTLLAATRMTAPHLTGLGAGQAAPRSVAGVSTAVSTSRVLAAADLLADPVVHNDHPAVLPLPAFAAFALAGMPTLLFVSTRSIALDTARSNMAGDTDQMAAVGNLTCDHLPALDGCGILDLPTPCLAYRVTAGQLEAEVCQHRLASIMAFIAADQRAGVCAPRFQSLALLQTLESCVQHL